jgi:hypothetical protein
VSVELHASAALLPGKNPVSFGYEAGGSSGPLLTFWRRENSLAPTGFRAPDRPASRLVTVLTDHIPAPVLMLFELNLYSVNTEHVK